MQKKLIEEEKRNKINVVKEEDEEKEKKEKEIFISSDEEDEDPVIKKQKEKKRKEKENKEREKFWRVGIVCNGQIYELTKHILGILNKNGYEWKTIESNYEFKCRKKTKNQTKNKSIYTVIPLHIRLRIFSYCGDDTTENKENHDYLIDLSKICGSIMEFLEFSRELISSMQQAGLVVVKY